jgi:hypothetical protein
MQRPEEIEYAVVLVIPVFGEERENAEEVIEGALDYLNTHRETPGFRFAPYVRAHLEKVSDVEDAQARLDEDDTVAMMILHGLDDDERIAFTRECIARNIPVCRTVPPPENPPPLPPREPGKPRRWEIRFRKRDEDDDEPHAHQILETTLSAPLEGDEDELMDRVGQLIAVMALGVMEHHFKTHPPQIPRLHGQDES